MNIIGFRLLPVVTRTDSYSHLQNNKLFNVRGIIPALALNTDKGEIAININDLFFFKNTYIHTFDIYTISEIPELRQFDISEELLQYCQEVNNSVPVNNYIRTTNFRFFTEGIYKHYYSIRIDSTGKLSQGDIDETYKVLDQYMKYFGYEAVETLHYLLDINLLSSLNGASFFTKDLALREQQPISAKFIVEKLQDDNVYLNTLLQILDYYPYCLSRVFTSSDSDHFYKIEHKSKFSSMTAEELRNIQLLSYEDYSLLLLKDIDKYYNLLSHLEICKTFDSRVTDFFYPSNSANNDILVALKDIITNINLLNTSNISSDDILEYINGVFRFNSYITSKNTYLSFYEADTDLEIFTLFLQVYGLIHYDYSSDIVNALGDFVKRCLDHYKKIHRDDCMVNHDISLYLTAFRPLFKRPENNDLLLSILCYKNDDIFDMANITKLVGIIDNTFKRHIKEVKEDLIQKIQAGKISSILYKDYINHYRKGNHFKDYLDVYDICLESDGVTLADIKRSASIEQINAMRNKELQNVFKPFKIQGKKIARQVLERTVQDLLLVDESPSPTALQKKLFYATKDIDNYEKISDDQFNEVVNKITAIDKLKGQSLQKMCNYTVELMDANDYRNLITGNATRCCMGAGTDKQKTYTFIPAFNQLVISRIDTKQIVVDSVLWKNVMDFAIMDNIEAVQTSTVNDLVYSTLLLESMQKLVKREKCKGFAQGSRYNDIQLYDTDAIISSNIPIAQGADGIMYEDFYTDAETVYVDFNYKIFDEELHFSKHKIKSINGLI